MGLKRTPRAPRFFRLVAVATSLGGLVAAPLACSKGSDGSEEPGAGPPPATGTNPTNPSCPTAPYALAGSHPAGLVAMEAGGVPVAVFYPAAQTKGEKASYDLRDWLPESQRGKIPDSAKPSHQMDAYTDAPLATDGGKFPVVLFSHGLGGYRLQSSFLMAHLASWGFIVVAPEHPERNLTAALASKFEGDRAPEQLRAALAAVAKDSRFAERADLTRVAVMGHSAGGAAVSTVAPDAEVKTWVMMASPGLGAGPNGKPSLMMCGTTDETALCKRVAAAWADQPGPTSLVRVNGAGHLGFSDLCTVAPERGGILGLAQEYGVDGVSDLLVGLAKDGCRPTDLKAEEGWPVINHYVTAHLRTAFGIDKALVAFDPVDACFASRVASVERRTSSTPPAPTDAGADVTVPPVDSGPDATVDEEVGKVACAGKTCSLPDVCCVTLSGSSCKAASACTGLSAPQACDGPEDCPAGNLCCAGFPEGASCRTSCTGSQQQLCHRDANCSGGKTCRPCNFPGGPPTLVCSSGC